MVEGYEKNLTGQIVFDDKKQIKLSVDEQINHLEKEHGIAFNIKGYQSAIDYLSKNNYYHKIKSYTANYTTYQKTTHPQYGKYCDLDFEYLVELSIIDMRLRRIIMEMSLDIEHFLKVRLISDITNNNNEDAYNIVEKYFNCVSIDKKKEVQSKLDNYYCNRYNQHKIRNLPAWELVEVLSFGDFICFYELYYSIYPNKNSMKNNLKPVQWLRNAAAHNNCIINDLNPSSSPVFEVNLKISNFVSSIPNISSSTREKKLSNRSVHDFVVMLYVFNNIVTSEQIRQKSMAKLKNFVDERMIYHKDYFKKNALIQSNYEFFKKIVDYCAINVL